MIVDTSAILALAFDEDMAARIFDVLAGPEPKRMSAANLFEALAVDRRNDQDAIRLVEESIARFALDRSLCQLSDVAVDAPITSSV